MKTRHLTTLLLAVISQWAGISGASEDTPASTVQQPAYTSLEQLLETDVITASKVARQVSDAPSAVTIVTAQDIHDYGYRNLSDILESMRGLYTMYDRAYVFLGGRGFGRPGDFTGRIMVLVDGQKVNNNIYESAGLEELGLLDTALIDRVEYVSGPGSVTYGNSAYFGTINIITKHGHDIGGLQVAGLAGSYKSYDGRVTYGKKLENGADILISASGFHSPGQSFTFDGQGTAQHLDGVKNQRLFAKAEWESWFIEAAFVERRKDIPTAPYGTDFGAPYRYEDSTHQLNIKKNADIDEHLKVSVHAYYSDFRYKGRETFSGVAWNEQSNGNWWGVDSQFVGTWFSNHQLVFGFEYRDDDRQELINPVSSAHDTIKTVSVYGQDEWRLTKQLTLNLGARYDDNTDHGTELSPRAAVIYKPIENVTLKLSHSQAFRYPNPFEKYYTDNFSLMPNPGLRPEYIKASELVAEYQPDIDTRIQGSLYDYRTQDSIKSQPLSPGVSQFQNSSGIESQGAEIELERHWSTGSRFRASYAYQDTTEANDHWAVNSPRHMAKLNVSSPVWQNLFRIGFETQMYSPRLTEHDTRIGSYAVSNLTLSSDRLLKGLDVSFTIRNLFDRDYANVAPIANDKQTVIPQDGRNFWLNVIYDFK